MLKQQDYSIDVFSKVDRQNPYEYFGSANASQNTLKI